MAGQDPLQDTNQPSMQGNSRSAGRVMIVEDHAMLAETLALGLSGSGFYTHIVDLDAAGGRDGAAPLIFEAVACRPDLVLLDLDLGAINGLDLVAQLRALGPAVLVITGCTDEERLAAALALGACGWVSKSEPFERLLEVSELAMLGGPLIPVSRRQELLEIGRAWLAETRDLESRLGRLTVREREVLAALGEGRSAQEIADGLVVSIGTVRTHIRAILSKLGVSTQLAAVAKAGHRIALGPAAPGTRAHGRPES